MTVPTQKTFGEFISERFGRNWVYAAHMTPQIAARYGADVVVLTPALQRRLKDDYAREWGRANDPVFWQMLCALRDCRERLALNNGDNDEEGPFIDAVVNAIERATVAP